MNEAVATTRRVHLAVFVAFGLSGAAALAYEVIWTRKLATIMGSSTYAMSTILAAFMMGLAVGAMVGAQISRRTANPLRIFGLCEVGIGLAGLFVIPLITACAPLYIRAYFAFQGSFTAFTTAQFALVFAVLLIPTGLMGMTFPLLVKYLADGEGDIGARSGVLYGANTIGAVLGSVLAGFVLIPSLGTTDGTLVAAAINLAVGGTILVLSRGLQRPVVLIPVALIALLFATAVDRPFVPFVSVLNAHRFQDAAFVEQVQGAIDRSDPNEVVLYHHEGLESDVFLMRDQQTGDEVLINNGKLEGGGASFELLAYLPAFSHHPARGLNVLNIGLGSGTTLSRLAELPEMRITSVELSAGVLEATRRFLRPELFERSDIEHVRADGRNYLLVQPDASLDLIVVSPSWAVEQASAGLTTDEFYALCAEKLADDGVIGVWLDPFISPPQDLEVVYRTFGRHFRTYVWVVDDDGRDDQVDDGVVVVGTLGRAPDSQMVGRALLAYRAEMEGRFQLVLDDEAVRALPEGPINTDELPIIEFRNARNIIVRAR